MPHSDNKSTALAIRFEVLYLLNLLLLPGIAFLILAWFYRQHKAHPSTLVRSHLQQTFFTSLIGGALIVLVIALLLVFGGFSSSYIWMWIILYFTLAHSTLVVFGALGLAKAMSSQSWRYPIIGLPLPKDN
ncbi:hypothetical protein SP60_04220 [Candidatus Thioglobus autotrophicus]|uniref:DUF4870 domain-containing protein n=1 Tax=Candidatus Thioglobus autotrophicus TaxID=1705394 RepID=A0A0M5LER5_9GAMM|nr:hypothetical protein [Candidatus Thioglobus autotrophicus]ALE52490.1 hypothetical protein SP60_04220 [Candidatus Thioglobus autotrophicus]WPE16514.1 hypothetical protein R5P06_00215 [Candidatus Thioglobus autotrophicus]WPE18061.1 hypothetical protein R5P05_00215 [Candidatus Thioglobus autotrophicus]